MNRREALIAAGLTAAAGAATYYSLKNRLKMFPSPYQIYFPLVMTNGIFPRYGVQVEADLTIPITINRIYQTGARWIGLNDYFDPNMQAFGSNPTIIGTKTCPAEYRLWIDKQGSPPKPEYYPVFANWIYEISLKYRPWAVEVLNEPDCVTSDVPNDQQYYYGACVGEDRDFYGWGMRYGELLSTVYQLLNSIGVKVIGGALTGTTPSPLNFLRGALSTGKMDMVSYHSYLREGNGFDLFDERHKRIQDVTDLPIIVTETAVVGDDSSSASDTPSLRARQAEYCAWLKERSQSEDFPIWLWYSSDNTWMRCGLKRDGELTPVYDVWAAE